MWWFDNIIDIETEPRVVVKYYHIDNITKVIHIHSKIAKDEDEFIEHYNRVKSL